MIEVEKKFILTEKNMELLMSDADFLSERTFTDIYFDTFTYDLTSKNMWLREREGHFELKVAMSTDSGIFADQYEEIEDEELIAKILKLDRKDSFTEDLKSAGIEKFCTCTTTRKKYKREEFIIDLDQVEFPEFTYTIGEIELMVETKDEIEDAITKILKFASDLQLEIAPVRGKVIEYLKRIRPIHYQALVDVGVVHE